VREAAREAPFNIPAASRTPAIDPGEPPPRTVRDQAIALIAADNLPLWRAALFL